MFIISGVFGGVLSGALCAILVALIACIPGLGFCNEAVIPTFYGASLIIGLWLGLKTYPL